MQFFTHGKREFCSVPASVSPSSHPEGPPLPCSRPKLHYCIQSDAASSYILSWKFYFETKCTRRELLCAGYFKAKAVVLTKGGNVFFFEPDALDFTSGNLVASWISTGIVPIFGSWGMFHFWDDPCESCQSKMDFSWTKMPQFVLEGFLSHLLSEKKDYAPWIWNSHFFKLVCIWLSFFGNSVWK